LTLRGRGDAGGEKEQGDYQGNEQFPHLRLLPRTISEAVRPPGELRGQALTNRM
jgi:hypothetical protein